MSDNERPRYRLLDKAFMAPTPEGGSRLLDAGTEIVYERRPSANMEPVNAAAEQMVAAANIRPNSLRPELSLPLHGPSGGEAGALRRQALGFDEMVDQRFAALEAQVADMAKTLAALARAKEPAPAPAPAPKAAPKAATPPPPPPPPPAKAA